MAAAALAGAAAPAQEQVWERRAILNKTTVSGPLVVLGDIDRDGWDDVMCSGVTVRDPMCTSDAHEMWILSGRTGATLRVIDINPDPRYVRLNFHRAGDGDGDGDPDYVVWIGDQGHLDRDNLVEVRSAKDDRLIFRVQDKRATIFGRALLGDVELDGDGRKDIVVTVPRGTAYGEFRAYSSRGRLLYRVPGTKALSFDWCGARTLAKVGDVDRDGADDYAVGAIRDVPFGFGGSVALISGRTGKILHVGTGAGPRDSLGHSVAGVGDLDLDGTPDFAGGTSKDTGGLVRAFSGRTGQPILTIRGLWSRSNLGWSVDGGADVDRDGVPDLIAGGQGAAPFGEDGVYVFSGRDGSIIWRAEREHELGNYVAMMPPQPGSPYGGFVVIDPTWQENGRLRCLATQGRLWLYRGAPAGVESYGVPCPGTLGASPKVGIRDLEVGGARLTVHDAASAAPALLLLGFSRERWGGWELPIRLDALGFRGCLLQTSVASIVAARTGGTGTAAGFAAVDLPLDPSSQGIPLHAQWLCFGTSLAARGASDALRWRVR